MELESLYEGIMNKGFTAMENQKEYVDNFIGDETDTRMGISLVIRPPKVLKTEIMKIENELKELENNQYYYPENDYHITLLDIITGRQGYMYTSEQIDNSKKIIIQALENVSPFEINLNGVIASDGAIIVRGFYEEEMKTLRQKLRQAIIENHMKPDERYPTISSHITIARFKKQIEQRERLIEMLKKYQNYNFGTFKVYEIELIYHNWYDSKKEILERYSLK